MVRYSKNRIVDVGPRSAHIAGLPYSAFEEFTPEGITPIQPLEKDPSDYLAIKGKEGIFALTPTCASNMMDLVPAGDPAMGNKKNIISVFEYLGKEFNKDVKTIASAILNIASEKVEKKLYELIKLNKLPKNFVTLVGGGGGSSAIIPFVAGKMGLKWRTAANNDVISAIGVAMAMVREVVEKSIISPGKQDIIKVRREAEEKAVNSGALPETVEVMVEVDKQRNIVRAIATGTTELREKDRGHKGADEDILLENVSSSINVAKSLVRDGGKTSYLKVFFAPVEDKAFFGIFRKKRREFRVIDNYGIIRLQILNGDSIQSKVSSASEDLRKIISKYTSYGDGGTLIPPLYFLFSSKILNLSRLQETEQIVSLVNMEIEGLDGKEEVIILVEKL